MGSSGSAGDQDSEGRPWRRVCRLRQCVHGEEDEERGALPPSHALAAQLASEKCFHDPLGKHPGYKRLAADADAFVPAAVASQIRLDVPRTFSALPSGRRGLWGWLPANPPTAEMEGEAVKVREATLGRVLLSHEWRAMGMRKDGLRSDDPEASTYVQGLNLLGAMCLGFVGGREEECFWLLLHLTEDVLSRRFLARTPPLLRFHGDKTAAARLVATEAPAVTAKLGPQLLAEAVSMLAARCFLSGFVGCLAPGPLLAFWEELLGRQCVDYPRFPLVKWLAGLIRHMEEDLLQIAEASDGPEIGPLFFRHVQQVGRALPDDWRPELRISAERIRELSVVSEEASQGYAVIHEAQQARESSLACLASMNQSATRLNDTMQAAMNLRTSVNV